MKGASILLIPAFVACSGSTDKVGEPTSTEDKLQPTPIETPPSSGAGETATQPVGSSTPPANPPTDPSKTPPPVDKDSCKSAETATECSRCCVAKNDPRGDLRACACNAGAKCESQCGGTLCNAKLPSVDCTLCLFQARCQLNEVSEVKACLEQSACQAKRP